VVDIKTGQISVALDGLQRGKASELAETAMRIGALEARIGRSPVATNAVTLTVTFPPLNGDVTASLVSFVRFVAEAQGTTLDEVVDRHMGR
jgi:hypothetical protein